VGGTDVNAMKYTYSYNEPVGEGVDIYILDGGVSIGNYEFEGRASFGWTPPTYLPRDGRGHGTHVAGIAAGKKYGVAKNANIISVKVISDSGIGFTDTIIAGINWISEVITRPSVVCMAFNTRGGSGLLPVAITRLIDSGVTVVVSAGNNNRPSLGNAPGAIVVGSSDITNTRAKDSNFGPEIDVFAPGVDITSAFIGGPNSTSVMSGTSMAAAHVTGLVACFLSLHPVAEPAAIKSHILNLATNGALSGLPRGTSNVLVFNDYDPDLPRASL